MVLTRSMAKTQSTQVVIVPPEQPKKVRQPKKTTPTPISIPTQFPGDTLNDIQFPEVKREYYKIPSFNKSVNGKNYPTIDETSPITFDRDEISYILYLFRNFQLVKEEIRGLLGIYFRRDPETKCLSGIVRNARCVSHGLGNIKVSSESPYIYISYGLTPEEVEYMADYHWDDLLVANTMDKISRLTETPHEQFRKVYPLNLSFLIAEIILTRKFSTPERLTHLIMRELTYLNEHEAHAMERITGEQLNLIMQDIHNLKYSLGAIAKKFKIKVPKNIKCQIFRDENIYRFLESEQQMQNKASLKPNLREVVENSDLRRYISEYF